MELTREQVINGLHSIEAVLEYSEKEYSPLQYEAHKECLEYAISVLNKLELFDKNRDKYKGEDECY